MMMLMVLCMFALVCVSKVFCNIEKPQKRDFSREIITSGKSSVNGCGVGAQIYRNHPVFVTNQSV